MSKKEDRLIEEHKIDNIARNWIEKTKKVDRYMSTQNVKDLHQLQLDLHEFANEFKEDFTYLANALDWGINMLAGTFHEKSNWKLIDALNDAFGSDARVKQFEEFIQKVQDFQKRYKKIHRSLTAEGGGKPKSEYKKLDELEKRLKKVNKRIAYLREKENSVKKII